MNLNLKHDLGSINAKFQWVSNEKPKAPKEAPPSSNYPEYPEYLVPSDDEVPIEDQPLLADASPTTLSLGYVADSDPSKEDPEEDPTDYPTDGRDDDNDDDDNDEEEELVPSCFAIFDLEPLSLSFDFVFTPEFFKSLSFRLDRLSHLAILCLDQHAHTLHCL
uniref:Uncharacterized protein n=1 Tax=Tanacetum cinerariifolium TaxID=118510 RepID=A0A6L2K982_TANCI|nr:hypothetical protein [Tanacetum cinerariifolium]